MNNTGAYKKAYKNIIVVYVISIASAVILSNALSLFNISEFIIGWISGLIWWTVQTELKKYWEIK